MKPEVEELVAKAIRRMPLATQRGWATGVLLAHKGHEREFIWGTGHFEDEARRGWDEYVELVTRPDPKP